MKKIFILLVSLFLLVSLTSCSIDDLKDALGDLDIGGGNEENPKTPDDGMTNVPTDGKTDVAGEEDYTINFYHTMGTGLSGKLDLIIKEFIKENPKWEINSVRVGGFDELNKTIISDLNEGTQPDLAYCYPEHLADYISSGKLVNMNNYIYGNDGYSTDELSDFVPSFLEKGYAKYYEGSSSFSNPNDLLILPYAQANELLFFNKDALNKLGLEIPRTWDELWNTCEIIKKHWPNCTPLVYDYESNWMLDMYIQNEWSLSSVDEPHYNFINDEAVNWLTELNSYYNKGYFTTMGLCGNYGSDYLAKDPDNGGAIFVIGTSAGISYYKAPHEIGISPIFGTEKDGTINNAAYTYGPSLCMFDTDSKNHLEKQEITWKFVKYLLEPSNQAKMFCATGNVPSRISSLETEEFKELMSYDNLTTKCLVASIANFKNAYSLPVFNDSKLLGNYLGDALVKSISGQMSAREALTIAYNNATRSTSKSDLEIVHMLADSFDLNEFIFKITTNTQLVDHWSNDNYTGFISWYVKEGYEDCVSIDDNNYLTILKDVEMGIEIVAKFTYQTSSTERVYKVILSSLEALPGEYSYVTNPVVGASYYLGCEQLMIAQNIYFTGKTTNKAYYLETTDNKEEAVIVTVVERDGGYLLSFKDENGNIKYLDIVLSGNYYNVNIVDEPVGTFRYDYEFNTFVKNIDGVECFIGTYNTYITLSANKYKFMSSSYPCHLYEINE